MTGPSAGAAPELVAGYEVHPLASVFPACPEARLADMAESVCEQGLLEPVVLDRDGRVIDGRSRLAACEMAGVTPRFVVYQGEDVPGYILARNITRRQLNQAQRAMLLLRWRAVSGSGTGLSRDDRDALAVRWDVSTGHLGQARAIAEHAPDLMDEVIAGRCSMDAAHLAARRHAALHGHRSDAAAQPASRPPARETVTGSGPPEDGLAAPAAVDTPAGDQAVADRSGEDDGGLIYPFQLPDADPGSGGPVKASEIHRYLTAADEIGHLTVTELFTASEPSEIIAWLARHISQCSDLLHAVKEAAGPKCPGCGKPLPIEDPALIIDGRHLLCTPQTWPHPPVRDGAAP